MMPQLPDALDANQECVYNPCVSCEVKTRYVTRPVRLMSLTNRAISPMLGFDAWEETSS